MDFRFGNVKDASAEQADTAFGCLASHRFEQLIGIFFLERFSGKIGKQVLTEDEFFWKNPSEKTLGDQFRDPRPAVNPQKLAGGRECCSGTERKRPFSSNALASFSLTDCLR